MKGGEMRVAVSSVGEEDPGRKDGKRGNKAWDED